MRTAIRPRELRAIPDMLERGNSVADIAVAFNISKEKAQQYVNGSEPVVQAQPETGLDDETPAPKPKAKAKGKAKGKA